MDTGVLERIRLLEADLEYARDAAVYQQLLPITNSRHVLLREHYVCHQRKVMQDTAGKLLDIYLDEDDFVGAQQEQQSLEDAVREYDAKVAQIREYSRTHSFVHNSTSAASPSAASAVVPTSVSDAVEYNDPAEDEPDVDAFLADLFTSVENYGTRLECYETGFNEYTSLLYKCATKDANVVATEKRKLKSVEDFAANIPSAFSLSTAVKLLLPADYEAFVDHILEYLTTFHKKLRPLEDRLLEIEMKVAESDMGAYWKMLTDASNKHVSSGSTASFQPPGRAVKYLPSTWRPHQLLRRIKQLQEQGGDVSAAVSAVEAELVWCESVAVKEAKVGKLVSGVLAEVCTTSESIFRSNMTKMPAEIQREKNHEDEAFLISLEDAANKKAAALSRNLAHSAEFDARLLDLGGNSAAGGGEEGIALAGTSGAHVTTVSLADETMVPLDEDGNPPPMWRIKMQGLKQKNHCEVCGGTVFSGPKVYREHFFSPRHTEGLRRLGIRNCKEFDGINTIDGVFDLARLMKGNRVLKRARDEHLAHELEDGDGLVYTRAEFQRRFSRS